MTSYKITITFPNQLYPAEQPSSEDIKKAVDWFRITGLKAGVSTEHHQTGRIHLECIIEYAEKQKASHIKRSLYSAMGFTQADQRSWDPVIKKRFIKVVQCNYLPGAINYVMKEGKMDLLKRGYSDTWIEEQVLEAERNRQKKEADECIYVNDSNFVRLVTAFVVDNNYSWSNLRQALRDMHGIYNFCRVRGGKHQIAYLEAKYNGNRDIADMMIDEWYPVGF